MILILVHSPTQCIQKVHDCWCFIMLHPHSKMIKFIIYLKRSTQYPIVTRLIKGFALNSFKFTKNSKQICLYMYSKPPLWHSKSCTSWFHWSSDDSITWLESPCLNKAPQLTVYVGAQTKQGIVCRPLTQDFIEAQIWRRLQKNYSSSKISPSSVNRRSSAWVR